MFGTTTAGYIGFYFTKKGNEYMNYQVIATHNPQDFFNGIEPDDLPEYYEATNENLYDIVPKCINDGYVVIVYPKED